MCMSLWVGGWGANLGALKIMMSLSSVRLGIECSLETDTLTYHIKIYITSKNVL